jgi:hypothetical protein
MTQSVRSSLYRAARLMGDVHAAEQGPGAMAKRYVRRKTFARSAGLTGSLLRSFMK